MLQSNYTLAKLRKSLNTLWKSRKYSNLRLIRSTNFGDWGGGNGYLGFSKFDGHIVIGQPKWGTRYNGSDLPSENFQEIFMVLKPDGFYMPTLSDITRNNLLRGMGFWQLQQQTHPNSQIAPHMGQKIILDPAEGLVDGGYILRNNGEVDYWGTRCEDPIVQVYDRSIYNRGVNAIKYARELLNVYIDRHGIIERPQYHWNSRWKVKQLWGIYNLIDRRKQISPPQLLKALGIETTDIPSYQELRTMWVREGIRVGFCRIAPRGTPLYNEVSLQHVQSPEPTLDEIITSS